MAKVYYEMRGSSENELSPEEKDFANRQIATVNNILYPEQNVNNHEDTYFYNEIHCPRMIEKSKAWPKLPLNNPLLSFSKPIDIGDMYQDLLNSQIQQYIKHGIDIGDILTYEDLTSKPFIDITKSIELDPKIKTLYNKIYFYEAEIDTLRNYGWQSILPCFDECVIKTNRKRYMHVKVLDINKTTQYIKLQIDIYIGNKRDWNKWRSSTIAIQFEPEFEQGLPCSWTNTDTLPNKYQMYKYIKDMNWTKEQIALWCDMFNINGINEPYVIKMDFVPSVSPFPTQAETQKYFTIFGNDNLKTMKYECGPHIHIVASGKDAEQYIKNKTATSILIEYYHTIALVNYKLYTTYNSTKTHNRIIENNPDGQYTFDDIIIKSDIKPTINISNA